MLMLGWLLSPFWGQPNEKRTLFAARMIRHIWRIPVGIVSAALQNHCDRSRVWRTTFVQTGSPDRDNTAKWWDEVVFAESQERRHPRKNTQVFCSHRLSTQRSSNITEHIHSRNFLQKGKHFQAGDGHVCPGGVTINPRCVELRLTLIT